MESSLDDDQSAADAPTCSGHPSEQSDQCRQAENAVSEVDATKPISAASVCAQLAEHDFEELTTTREGQPCYPPKSQSREVNGNVVTQQQPHMLTWVRGAEAASDTQLVDRDAASTARLQPDDRRLDGGPSEPVAPGTAFSQLASVGGRHASCTNSAHRMLGAKTAMNPHPDAWDCPVRDSDAVDSTVVA
eukprot:scaffold291506_cov18-Prasinocladus_malaysianus.AAC.1